MEYNENHLTAVLEHVGRAYHESFPGVPPWDEMPANSKQTLKQTLLPVVLSTLEADEQFRPRITSVWTLTVDTKNIATQVFRTEQECYDSLRSNYAEDFEGNDDALIDELIQRQGVVLYIEEHSL